MSSLDTRLAIDIGNSAVKALVFRDGKPQLPVERLAPDNWAIIDRLVTNLGVKSMIYSTVANVPPAERMDRWMAAGCRILALTAETPLPFRTTYTTLATLGHDRRAGIAGAISLVKEPVLIADAGSCLTLDLVDGTGTHLGGNISPGLRMRLTAMHEQTGRLPLVTAADPTGPVGDATTTALRHGAQLGLVYEIEGLYRRLLPDHPGLRVVLTGGDGEWLAGRLDLPFLLYPNLVLHGLYQILSRLC